MSCSTRSTPRNNDSELTKPIKKIAPKNKNGVPFGKGLVWEDYEAALIDQWKHVDNGNDRFKQLRK